MGYTKELSYRIYDDATGDYISISPDADTGNCIEMRQYDKNGKIEARIVFLREQAQLINEALADYLTATVISSFQL